MRPWRALGMVRRFDFETPDYRFVAPPFTGDAPVLEGRVYRTQLQPGVWLHCAEVLDLHSMASEVPVESGLRLVMVLAGELDVTLGGQRLQLRADRSRRQAGAALISMPQPALFERRWKRGKWERKLSLYFSTAWLQAQADLCGDAPAGLLEQGVWEDLLRTFMQGGQVSILPWQPSPRAIALAEQLILDADSSATGARRLWQSARALELLHEALAGHQAPAAVLRLRGHERMLRLRSFLDAEIGETHVDALTVEALGRRFGLSASALQRQFRQAFGVSVNEYRRSMRLLQARADLERGSSVALAASRAGYTSAANFSTAFRRQFGASPSEFRLRL